MEVEQRRSFCDRTERLGMVEDTFWLRLREKSMSQFKKIIIKIKLS